MEGLQILIRTADRGSRLEFVAGRCFKPVALAGSVELPIEHAVGYAKPEYRLRRRPFEPRNPEATAVFRLRIFPGFPCQLSSGKNVRSALCITENAGILQAW